MRFTKSRAQTLEVFDSCVDRKPLTTANENIISSGYDMTREPNEHELEFLLAFDERVHRLEEGYWIKFEIKRVPAAKRRPHGLSYSLTLHAPTANG
jgi:hypothetical protein